MSNSRRTRTTTSSATRAPATAQRKRPRTKSGAILALLSRKSGARLVDLEKLTGWQPHSIRAALTVLRRQGHVIVRDTTARGASRYRLRGAARS